MTERWRGVLAALLNDDLRAVLRESFDSAPLTGSRRERAISRLEDLGLVRREGDAVEFDDQAIRGILSEGARPKPTGPERFLDRDGHIDRYPMRDDDRRALLEWVAERALDETEVLSEVQVNERLSPFAPDGDVAVLRRHLVDHGLLERTRSGSEYARVGPQER